jgi:hypothetical protein
VPGVKTTKDMVKPLKERILQTAARLDLVACPGDPNWNPRPIDGNQPFERSTDDGPYFLRMFFQHKTLKDLADAEKFRTYTVLSLADEWDKKTNKCQAVVSFSVRTKKFHNYVWKPVETQVHLHRHMCEELAEDTDRFLSRYPAPDGD